MSTTRQRIFRPLIALCLMCSIAEANEIRGKVITVTDGETISVVDQNKALVRVRLQGIDAPEEGQPFCTKAKETLTNLVHRKEVSVTFEDKAKSLISGTVFVDGLNVNEEMLKLGMAWNCSTDERMVKLESEARAAKVGLWSAINPVPPWEYRKQESFPSTKPGSSNRPPKTAAEILADAVPPPSAVDGTSSGVTSTPSKKTAKPKSKTQPADPPTFSGGYRGADGRYVESDAEKAYERATGKEIVHMKNGKTYERKARTKK